MKIDELIKVPLSKKILFERLQDVSLIADYRDQQVVFDTVSRRNSTKTGVDSNGYIVVDEDDSND